MTVIGWVTPQDAPKVETPKAPEEKKEPKPQVTNKKPSRKDDD